MTALTAGLCLAVAVALLIGTTAGLWLGSRRILLTKSQVNQIPSVFPLKIGSAVSDHPADTTSDH